MVTHIESPTCFWGQAVETQIELLQITENLVAVCPSAVTLMGQPHLDKVCPSAVTLTGQPHLDKVCLSKRSHADRAATSR